MSKTQYSDLVPNSLFHEYKKSATTEERREQIVDEIFNTIRSVNTFPEPIIEFNEELQALRTLATFDPWGIYNQDTGEISISSVGVMLCSKFYPNIYDVAKKGAPLTMRDGFNNDRILRRSIEKILKYGDNITQLMGWIRISGCGYCNNFRPTAAKVVYDTNLKPGSRVYDYAAGYGGRLMGAWAAENVVEYVAVEPNTATNENAHKFYNYINGMYPNLEKAEIYCHGSEDFTIERYPQYEGYFDMAFSSPQYFDTEIYCTEETQSCMKFNSYERWVKGFLRPTIHNCIDVLKPDGIYGINIFANLPNIKQVIQYICMEKDFELYKVDKLILQVMPGIGKDGKARTKTGGKPEPIWLFKRRGC